MSVEDSTRPVTAVIVTYQSANTVSATLAAARRCHDAQLLDCVIVDNGSKDGTPEMLEREAGWARVVITGRNNGFGRGCNIGLAHVNTPYTIFINPDAWVEPDALRIMMTFMEENPRVGIVGPATLAGDYRDPPGLQGTGPRPTPTSILRAAVPLLDGPKNLRPIVPGSAPFRTGWVCGAVFMVRTELMKRLGGFDPRFFLYWEETDVCRRADDSGFEVWAVGTAVANHIGGASSTEDDTRISGCIAKHYYQSRRYYMVKHHGWLAATFAEIGEFVLLGVRAIGDVLRGRGLSRLRPRLQAALLSQPDRV
jgi:N-acetylglucosaminyl-diphospho-decaprenol L-rhamnosyltransferase